MDKLEQKIFDITKNRGLACLATITEDGLPWARYVIAQGYEDMTIRVSTFLMARKVKQIAKNPNVHLVCGVPNAQHQESYLQIKGKAKVSSELSEKKAFWSDNLKGIFKGPEDPNYGIIIIKPDLIELWSGMFEPEIWRAKESKG